MACNPFRFVALLLLLTAVTSTLYEANKRYSAASNQTLVTLSTSVVRYGSRVDEQVPDRFASPGRHLLKEIPVGTELNQSTALQRRMGRTSSAAWKVGDLIISAAGPVPEEGQCRHPFRGGTGERGLTKPHLSFSRHTCLRSCIGTTSCRRHGAIRINEFLLLKRNHID